MPNTTTYTLWLAEVTLLATGNTAPSTLLQAEAPSAIDYAELRIQRDLDLISTITRDATQTTTSSNRNVTVPSAFVAVNGVNIITPAGTSNPELGKRNQLTKVSTDVLDALWPDVTGASVPTLFSLLNQSQILLGPWPNAGFTVEFVGTQRMTPISSGNQTNFISLNLPDLLLAASMIHISGYMKNFGAQVDNPQMAVSWDGVYKGLLASADAEELRKRYAGTAAMPPPGMAKQPVTSGAASR